MSIEDVERCDCGRSKLKLVKKEMTFWYCDVCDRKPE